jgi:hypothetical protein
MQSKSISCPHTIIHPAWCAGSLCDQNFQTVGTLTCLPWDPGAQGWTSISLDTVVVWLCSDDLFVVVKSICLKCSEVPELSLFLCHTTFNSTFWVWIFYSWVECGKSVSWMHFKPSAQIVLFYLRQHSQSLVIDELCKLKTGYKLLCILYHAEALTSIAYL